MWEEDTADTSYKALIDVFTRALTNVKVSLTDTLKPLKFDWNLQDQFENFQLFPKGVENWYKLQGIEEKDGDDTHLEYLLNFMGPIGQKKHEQWTLMVRLQKSMRRQRKVPHNSWNSYMWAWIILCHSSAGSINWKRYGSRLARPQMSLLKRFEA